MTTTISSREGLGFELQQSLSLISTAHQSDEVDSRSTAPTDSAGQEFFRGLEIGHASNGRVRICTTDGNDLRLEDLTKYLEQSLEQHTLKEVSLAAATSSIVVKFDQQKLSLFQMLDVLAQVGIHQQTLHQPTDKTDPFATWKSAAFWKEQTVSFIPLMVGLAVTGRLGISGLAAIPIYMVTAEATRLVMGCVEPLILDSRTKSRKNSQSSLSKKVDNKSAVKDVATAKIAYSVVHSIPGRIRFNVPRLVRDRAYGRRLERLLKIDPQVTNVRVNHDAASLTIAFISKEMPLSHWVHLMELADEAQISTDFVTIEQPLKEVISQPVSSAISPTVVSPWSELKPPALSTLLDMIANLSLEPVSN